MFEKCPPEKLGVDTSIKGTLPVGTSPTEKFFCEHMDLEDWVSEKLLPPPSPTFYRAPPRKRLVYVVANDEYEFEDLDNMPKFWFARVANFEHPLKWKKTNMDAVVLLLPGVFDEWSLAMDLCPHPRLEIIGVGTTSGDVQLRGACGGFPLDNKTPSAVISIDQGSLRINNVTIRHDREADSVSLCGEKTFLELDTVSVYSKWATGIMSERSSHLLLRNVMVSAKENGVHAGRGLIILNSNFHGCGSERFLSSEEEEMVHLEYTSISLRHYTHFLMWNSQVQNGFGHSIGKRRQIESDPKTQRQYELLVHNMELGPLPHNMDPKAFREELLDFIESENKEFAALPEGHRRLHNASFVNNRKCDEECELWLNDPLKGYCPLDICEECGKKFS